MFNLVSLSDKGISPKKRLKPLADEESALEEELNSIPRLIRNNHLCAVCHRKLEVTNLYSKNVC